MILETIAIVGSFIAAYALFKPSYITYETASHSYSGAINEFDKQVEVLEKLHGQKIIYVKSVNHPWQTFVHVKYKLVKGE